MLGPSVLAVFGARSTARWPNVEITTAVVVVMLVIAVLGIRLTARTQVGLAAVEYLILIGFAVAGLVFVIGHHPGTFPITRHGSASAGLAAGATPRRGSCSRCSCSPAGTPPSMSTRKSGTAARTPAARHARRRLPGRDLHGVGHGPAGGGVASQLQAHSASALVYLAQALGGSGWAKVMALALALSVIGSTGTSIVVIARILYGMASYRALPDFLGRISPRFSTPVVASILVGLIFVAIIWVYLLSVGAANVFDNLISLTGIVCAAFYALTALQPSCTSGAASSATGGTGCSSASSRSSLPGSWPG